MKKIKIIGSVAIVLLIIVASAVYGIVKIHINNNHESEISKIQLIEKLDNSITKEKIPFSSSDSQALYEELNSSISKFNDDDLLLILKEPNIAPLTKSTVLQVSKNINNGQGILDSEKFKALIKKGTLTDDVRISLIQNIKTESSDLKNELAFIAENENGDIVMRALMKLEESDALMALEVSNKILSNHSKYNEDNICAAITVKSNYFRDLAIVNSTVNVDDEKTEYIELCKLLYNDIDNAEVKDSIIFSLMNIRDFEAVKTIINDKNIDNQLKIACISRNAQTFIDVINNSPTKADVEFIIQCMELVPLKELAKPMREKLLNNDELYSNRLMNIISFMEVSGVQSDSSRFDRVPTSNWIK